MPAFDTLLGGISLFSGRSIALFKPLHLHLASYTHYSLVGAERAGGEPEPWIWLTGNPILPVTMNR